MPFCSNCGSTVSEQDRFCTQCGTPMEKVLGVKSPTSSIILTASQPQTSVSTPTEKVLSENELLPETVPHEPFKWLMWGGLIVTAIGFLVPHLLVIGIPMLIAAQVFWYIALYRAWKSIPVQHRRTTPGKAVGLMFVPFFNLFYWQFVAVRGLAIDANKYGLPAEDTIRQTVATAFCILTLCSLIPYVNYVTGIAAMGTMHALMNDFNKFVTMMAARRSNT